MLHLPSGYDGRVRRSLLGFLAVSVFACGGRSELPFLDTSATPAATGGASGGGGTGGGGGTTIGSGGAGGSGGATIGSAGQTGSGGSGGASGCPLGQHLCGGACVSDFSVQTCGVSCTPCPVPPNSDGATCDGMACDPVCSAGFAPCGSACLDLQSDGANCGSCGHDCLGGACQAGVCQPAVLLSGHPLVHFLAVDATSLYFTVDPGGSPTGGSVQKMPLAGGPVTTLASGLLSPQGIAVDPSFVYWASEFGDTITRLPLGGGTPVTLLSGVTGALGVAVDGSAIYFSRISGGAVWKAPLSGGAPTLLASSTTTPNDGAVGIAVRATNLYFGTYSAVEEVSIAGGAVTTLVTGQNDAIAVAVDDTFLYWTNLYGGGLMRKPLAGGPATSLLPGLSTYGDGIAVDAKAIYFAIADASNVSTILRLAK
jgi:hypothetical protein